MRSFVFIVLLFLAMTQNICLGVAAATAQSLFKIDFDEGVDKPITAALENLLLSHPQANKLIRRIVAKKNEAVRRALIDQYMNQLPTVASKILSSLKNSHNYKQFTPESIEARTASHRDILLIRLLRAGISNNQPVIDEALSTEINNVIEQLCSKLSPEDLQKCYFISKFIKSIISTSLQQKGLIDELIFCLFIDPKSIIERYYKIIILDKMVDISFSPYIHIIQGAKTCFAEIKGDQKELAIRINSDDLTSLPQVNVLKKNQHGVYLTTPGGDYKLAKETSSLEAILMHELIHMLHFVEDQETFNRDSKSEISPYWNFSNWQDSRVFSSLWFDVEEQRTIIGRQGFQDISELSMRLIANLPMRYPYLGITDTETEVDKNIINAIVANYVLPTSVE